jgi:hypothetical protein
MGNPWNWKRHELGRDFLDGELHRVKGRDLDLEILNEPALPNDNVRALDALWSLGRAHSSNEMKGRIAEEVKGERVL